MRIGDPITHNGQRCVIVGFYRRGDGPTIVRLARVQ